MPDTELDPISISSDTDCEQMDEIAGDDNVDQEIYSRNDEADSMGIATRDEEINNYEIRICKRCKYNTYVNYYVYI